MTPWVDWLLTLAVAWVKYQANKNTGVGLYSVMHYILPVAQSHTSEPAVPGTQLTCCTGPLLSDTFSQLRLTGSYGFESIDCVAFFATSMHFF